MPMKPYSPPPWYQSYNPRGVFLFDEAKNDGVKRI